MSSNSIKYKINNVNHFIKRKLLRWYGSLQTIPMHVSIALIANLSTIVLSGNALWTNNEYGSSDLATGEEKYLRINGN